MNCFNIGSVMEYVCCLNTILRIKPEFDSCSYKDKCPHVYVHTYTVITYNINIQNDAPMNLFVDIGMQMRQKDTTPFCHHLS